MKAFEIHTFHGGKWKIDSVFDDRDLAMFEAGRMDDSRRYSGIRVIEEVFDEASQQSTTKTIFRGGQAEQAIAKPPPSKPKPAPAKAKTPPKSGAKAPRRPARKPPEKEKKKSSASTLVVVLVLVVVIGAGVVIGLRLLSQAI